jgi:asparagine synthase (glutamine-hydrolysing)
MCGIVGAVGLAAPLTPEDADAILHTIEHRGPDSGGSVALGDTWLGVRRLRILDLRVVADQPAADEATGVTLVFNGEIYNYVELRRELEAKGHSFRTTGDTEVLLRGYIEWGDGLFERCNGMWAVAIHDPRRDGVLLARDRFGEKPLFVGRAADGAWWFGSEVAALRRGGAGTGRLNRRRALGFLLVGDAEDPSDSFLEGITQLPGGAHATLTRRGLTDFRTWWDPQSFVDEHWAGGATIDETDILAALDHSVELRLRSDVEVGTSLSGGIDSSLVVTSIRQLDPERRIHTFTASFPDNPVDEWPRASIVAEQERTTPHRVIPTAAGFLEELDDLIEHQGGPIESPSVYAQWCVMRAALEAGVTVLLDGQGADETWGGYPKHFWFGVGDALARGRAIRAVEMVRTWRGLGPLPRVDLRPVASLALPAFARRGALRAAATAGRRSIGPALTETISDPQGPASGPLLERAATVDAGRVILPRLLRYADRNSMAWSRELRLPYLDPAVAALGLASGWRDGLASGWTKHALRRAAATRLPAQIVWNRQKVAYQTPDKLWLRDPAIAAAIGEAANRLVADGILTAGGRDRFSPWRTLSLGRLLSVYRLTV